MDGEIDFTKYSEAELLEVWGRIDPRSAPINCARLKELLVERGYIVQGGTLLPGSATPSPAKLQALIGSDRPISCEVTFGGTSGLFGWLAPAYNAFGLVGSGRLTADGVHVQLSGKRGVAPREPSPRWKSGRWRKLWTLRWANTRSEGASKGTTI
jgi:hypothetical protein